MSEKIDIDSLTRILVKLNDVHTSSLFDTYSPYSLYVENRTGNDIPNEYNTNLYDLYNDGIDNLKEDGWNVTIGEKIISHRQIWLKNNYNAIKKEFGEVDSVIEYDKINKLAASINEKQDFNEITATIYKFIQKEFGIDFSINPNPENSDNSNLILTHKAKQKIQSIVESILNKVFRNLIQLIRVKRDYRLYGRNTTVFGGKSELSSTAKMRAWSSLPASCWRQYSGNYIVGKQAYNEDVGSIGRAGIKNTRTNFSSYYVFGIKAHTHNVSVSEEGLPDSHFSVSKSALKGNSGGDRSKASHIDDQDDLTLWSKAAITSGLKGPPKGFGAIGSEKASIACESSWSYSWSTNSYCKLVVSDNMSNDVFSKSLSYLPTYASYVWRWVGNDDTNITSPSKDISVKL